MAQEVASAVDHNVRCAFGGREHYIHAIDKAEWHKQILEDFDGRNYTAVYRKWDISRRTLFYIIAGSGATRKCLDTLGSQIEDQAKI